MGQHKSVFRGFRKRKQKTGSWVGREAGVDLGDVGARNVTRIKTHCMKELIKMKKKKIRSEQARDAREKPLMAPTLQYQGQHRKLPSCNTQRDPFT